MKKADMIKVIREEEGKLWAICEASRSELENNLNESEEVVELMRTVFDRNRAAWSAVYRLCVRLNIDV